MFYLKYRPQTIEEIDNSRIKELIKKILTATHLPHAFLFYGQKGTGKTSTARIFAKTINCLNNFFSNHKIKEIEPCNQCSNCLAITNGTSTDVIEIDAASNRGIDEVKKIIQETSFLPMTSKYRVYIIDEAHMITQEGFNALLKTLEEPPSSVIFILATTNKDKIPKTIISRCYLLNFGQAKKSDIISMIQRIIKNEKISLDEKVINLIADYSDYSFRDAAKILEELIIQNKTNFEEAKKYLGITKKNFLEIISSYDKKMVFSWLEEFSSSGGSFKSLLELTLQELRLILLKHNQVEIDEETKVNLSLKETIILIKLLTEAYQNLKISPIESLPVEIAIIEFYNKIKQ